MAKSVFESIESGQFNSCSVEFEHSKSGYFMRYHDYSAMDANQHIHRRLRISESDWKHAAAIDNKYDEHDIDHTIELVKAGSKLLHWHDEPRCDHWDCKFSDLD